MSSAAAPEGCVEEVEAEDLSSTAAAASAPGSESAGPGASDAPPKSLRTAEIPVRPLKAGEASATPRSSGIGGGGGVEGAPSENCVGLWSGASGCCC